MSITGKQMFDKFEFIITLMVRIDSIIPRKINEFLFVLCKNITGKAGQLIRYILLKNLALKCGRNVSISENVWIYKFKTLSIGDNVSIHQMCYIDAGGGIDIGNNVAIAHSSTVISAEHTYSDLDISIKYNPVILKKTIIEEDVWIGCGARILGGVIIHSHSIVAAGAVVVKDVPTHTIVGGVPAKKIKQI